MQNSTSWQNSKKWYNEKVGEEGHYYHRSLLIPHALRLLHLNGKSESSLLDLACGQGVMSRHIPVKTTYLGLDISPGLIKAARGYSRNSLHEFDVADVTRPLKIKKNDFSHAIILLAIQNIEQPFKVFQNAYQHLQMNGKLLIIMNHPCFRIPRQSFWKVDEAHKIQYRRIDRYMSDMKIPIQTNPGKGEGSMQTWSFHHPLSAYCNCLYEAGFMMERIEEWCSDKVSEGGAAKMENRARDEIPLFMGILAEKKV